MRITSSAKWVGSGSSWACRASVLLGLLLMTEPLLSAPPFSQARAVLSSPQTERLLSRGELALQPPPAAEGGQEATLQSRHKHSVGSSPHALPLTWTYAAFLRSQRRSLLTNSK